MVGALLWARAEVRDGWRSLIVVGALVSVVVGSVLALLSGASRAGSAPERFAANSDLAEIVVFIGDRPPNGLVQEIAGDPRVERLSVSRVVRIAAGAPAGPDTNGIIGVDDQRGGFGRPHLVSGRYPTAGSTDEILVGERGARSAGIALGDRLPVTALPCLECEETSIGEASVVGIVRLTEDLVDDPAPQLTILAGTTLLDGRWREAEQPGTILSLHVADGVDRPTLTADLSTQVGSLGNVSDQEVDTETVQRAAALQRDALYLLAAVAAAAGAVVVAQAVARHLQRRPSDAPALEALGLDRRRRTSAGVMSVLPAVLGGTVAGVVLAVATSGAFPLGGTRLVEPHAGIHVDLPLLALSAALALIATASVATVAARRWARTHRSATPTGRSAAATLIEKLRLRPAAATGARFALDAGTGAQRMPVVPTLATVSATIAIGVAALVVHTNLDRVLAEPARYGQPWDYAVAGRAEHESLMRDFSADPRIAGADLARAGELDVTLPDGRTTQIKAVGIAGLRGPTALVMRSGRPPIGLEEVAVAGETMALLGVAVGDRIEVTGGCGTRSSEVVGEPIVPLVDQGDPGEGIVLSLEGFDALCADQLAAPIDRTSDLLLRFEDDDDAAAVAAELAADGAFVDRRYVPADVSSMRDLRQVPVAVAVAVLGLGLVAVAHALVLAARRRRRDLGVLRALGMRPGDASATVRWQATIVAVAAALVGVPAGLIGGRALWLAIAEPIHVLLDVDIPRLLVAGAGAAVVVMSSALAIVPARRAACLAPAQVLRSE